MQKLLIKNDVSFLIVHSTYTTVHVDPTLSDVLRERQAEGFPDIGYHFVIGRSGEPLVGTPIHLAATHTPRFANISIGVLMVGGKSKRGRPMDNYEDSQKESLRQLLKYITSFYPNIKPIGAGAVLGGTSPHFNLEIL